jgi:hypothetical protein
LSISFPRKCGFYFLKKKSDAFVELKYFKATIEKVWCAHPCSPSSQPGTHFTKREYFLQLPFKALSGREFGFLAEPIDITMQTKSSI